MKSRCFSFDEHILYMDGLLSQDLHWAFESHVSNCDQCLKKNVAQSISSTSLDPEA